jgi:putative transposase
MYKRQRFPPVIIQYAVWVYFRFNLSIGDVEDLLAQRELIVSYEASRLWVNKFGSQHARRLKKPYHGYGD